MNSTPNGNGKTNSTNNSAASGVRSGIPKFVKYRLTDEELVEARSSIIGGDVLILAIAQVIDAGYKFSVSRDTYGGGYQAFLTPSVDTDANFGWTLTSRAPVLEAAASILLWKHYSLFKAVWPKDQTPAKGGGWG